jgi:DUF4097 and DUF4098 domain-containing protein YvlB
MKTEATMRVNNKLVLLVVTLFIACNLPAVAQVTENENFVFNVSGTPKLKFKNIVGDLELKGWDKPSIEVKVEKKASGRDAQKMLDSLKVNVNSSGNVVVVSVDYPSKKNWKERSWNSKDTRLSVDFEIFAPRETFIRIDELVSGDVSVTDFSSDLEVSVISGDLTGRQLAGKVSLTAISGDIEVEGLFGESVISVMHGEIDLSQVTGDLEIDSTHGDITIEAIDLEGLEINNTSGDIKVDVESVITFGSFSIDSFNGDIEFVIPRSSNFSAVLQNAGHGDVESDFELKRTKKMMMNLLQGEINGGGASLVFEVMNGDIDLLWK